MIIRGVYRDVDVSPVSYSDRRRPSFVSGLDRTRQEFREETDVNNVVRRFKVSGDLGRVNPRTGEYLDVSEVPDLLTALEQANQALDSFRALPDDVRRMVGDDPRRLVELAQHQAAVAAFKAAQAPKETPPSPAPPAGEPTP